MTTALKLVILISVTAFSNISFIFSNLHFIRVDTFLTFRTSGHFVQESRAFARKPRDAAAVLFRLKFAESFKSQASELQIYRRKTEFIAKLSIQGHPRSRVLEPVERR